MSLVIGIVSTNSAIIVSDGRVINANTNSIVNENFDKTRKINENVILGFSGETKFSLWLLEQFENIYKKEISNLKADQVAEILCKVAKEGVNYRMGLNESVSTKFQMIVSGVNHEGIMALYNFGVPTNFEISKVIPIAKSFIYSVLSPGTKDFGAIFEKIIEDFLGRELEYYINLLFFKASIIEDSINTNLFIKEIKSKEIQ